MVRIYTIYHPLRVFVGLGAVVGLVGAAPIGRFLWFWWRGDGGGHIQSLVLGGVLAVMGLLLATLGLMGELISVNRQLLEVVLEKVRSLEAELLPRSGVEIPEVAPPADATRRLPGTRPR